MQPVRRVRTKTTKAKRVLFATVAGLLCLIAIAFLVIVLEFVASFHVKLPAEEIVRDARLNHAWLPGRTWTHDRWAKENPEFPEPYTHYYNGQGWIETYDIQKPKPTGTYRIFYVGDSFTEGCVPMDDSVASRLETRLAEEFPDAGLRFEVVNTGTASYSPVIYYILTRYFLTDYAPDVVVVNVDMTDEFDDWKYRQTLILDPEGSPFAAPPRDLYESEYVDTLQGAVRLTALGKLRLFLAENSFIYNYLKQSRTGDETTTAPAPSPEDALVRSRWAWCNHEWSEETEADVEFTLDMLRRLATYCREHSIRLVLTSVPHFEQYDLAPDGRTRWSTRPHDEIRKLAEQTDSCYIDSYNGLRSTIAETAQHEYYYRNDMHLNPRGNALWADVHIRAFLDPANALLPTDVYHRESVPDSENSRETTHNEQGVESH